MALGAHFIPLPLSVLRFYEYLKLKLHRSKESRSRRWSHRGSKPGTSCSEGRALTNWATPTPTKTAFDYESAIFGDLAVKYKQSGLLKNADTVFGLQIVSNMKCYINWCHQTQTRPTWKLRKGKQRSEKQSVRSLYLFEISKYKSKQRFREFLKISFSVIYRFIRLRHENNRDMLH